MGAWEQVVQGGSEVALEEDEEEVDVRFHDMSCCLRMSLIISSVSMSLKEDLLVGQ